MRMSSKAGWSDLSQQSPGCDIWPSGNEVIATGMVVSNANIYVGRSVRCNRAGRAGGGRLLPA